MVADLKKRIGLFGGSFNPAHAGHVYVSRVALETLGLDEVWWLVSPKNPLKNGAGLADYQARLDGAEKLAGGLPVKVLDVEKTEGLKFTIETVRFLKDKFPDHAFVWLMGADCFLALPKWKSWRDIMAEIPLAVLPRPGFTEAALSGTAATVYAKNRLSEKLAGNLVMTKPPAWVYIDCKPMAISATEIRSQGRG